MIGVGNVAVDVARILARDPHELHATDVPQPVLDALHASKVREVHMIGRARARARQVHHQGTARAG